MSAAHLSSKLLWPSIFIQEDKIAGIFTSQCTNLAMMSESIAPGCLLWAPLKQKAEKIVLGILAVRIRPGWRHFCVLRRRERLVYYDIMVPSEISLPPGWCGRSFVSWRSPTYTTQSPETAQKGKRWKTSGKHSRSKAISNAECMHWTILFAYIKIKSACLA